MVSQALVGRTARVVRRVRGGALPGEVRLTVDGLAHYYLAYSIDPIDAGTEVLVIHCRGARAVDVEPWSPAPTGIADARPDTEGI